MYSNCQVLAIKDFYTSINGKKILNGVNLSVNEREVHFLMGPNGSGKSTLAHVLMGDPRFSVTSGNIFFQGENIISLSVEERAKKGLYVGFQYPAEVPGVGMKTFLRSALLARGERVLPENEFMAELAYLNSRVGLSEVFMDRNVNEGFSGGEKKRSELLQLLVLKPKLAILDEFDSGLDADGLRFAAEALKSFMSEKDRSLIIITHYGRIAEYLKPDRVHVMIGGKIVKSGEADLIDLVEKKGYIITPRQT